MNRKFAINLIVMSLCLMNLTAKNAETSSDSLTVAEMKTMFYQHYENGVSPPSLDDYDLLKWSIHSKDPMNFCYLVNNEILKKPKGIQLPTSEYVFYGDTLCWVKPRQAVEFKQLVQKLQNKYGKIYVNDTLTLIPAKWMTGKIEFLSGYPEEYATTYFSTMAYKKNIDHGIISGSDMSMNYISMDLGSSKLAKDVSFIVKGNNGYSLNNIKGVSNITLVDRFNIPKEEIVRNRKLGAKKLFILFARDINRICPPAPKDYDYANPKIYSLLLYFDAQRYVHVEVLLPRQTDEKDQFMLSNLRKAIESQPAGLFESHFTIDGKIFPGLYIKAYYGGLGWNFFDYRALDEE
jgi:hypothetical protein